MGSWGPTVSLVVGFLHHQIARLPSRPCHSMV